MGAEPLRAGTVLHGTYELVSHLGQGGMGTVWRARHVRLPREVAIKVLNEAAYEDMEILQRFRREAEITSQLGHPHIVEVFDFNVLDDGRAYLAMELLQGESLRERLRRGPMTVVEAMEVVRQVGSGLARAHAAGIIHRDLKPENIFLCDDGTPGVRSKVLDFGISKIQGSQSVVTQDSSLLGTPKYMSPEQAKGENTSLDDRTDQFSLAAIAYEMVTGTSTFAADSIHAVLYKVLSEDPPPVDAEQLHLSPAVAEAIQRGLSKNREDRFDDVSAFLDAIESGGPTESNTLPSPTASGNLPVATTAAPRRMAPVAAGAAVLVVAAAFGVWAMSSKTEVVRVATLESNQSPTPQPAVAPDAAVSAQPDAAVEPPSDPHAETPPARPPRERPRIAPPPKLGPLLTQAQKKLRAKDYDGAIQLARRGLRDEGKAAFEILTAAYCGKRDLGNAKAMYRSVPRGRRARVRSTCRKLGLQL